MKKRSLKKWTLSALCGALIVGMMPMVASAETSTYEATTIFSDEFNESASIPGWEVHSGYATLLNTLDETTYKDQNRHLLVQGFDQLISVTTSKFAVIEEAEAQISGKVYWNDAATENLHYVIEFYNNANELITIEDSEWSTPNDSIEQWLDYSVTITVPAEAVTASLSFYTSSESGDSFMLDDVLVSMKLEDESEQIAFAEDFSIDLNVLGWTSTNKFMPPLTAMVDGKQVLLLDDIYTAVEGTNNAQLQLHSEMFDVTAGKQYELFSKVNAVHQTHQFNMRIYFYGEDNQYIRDNQNQIINAAITNSAGTLLGKGWTDLSLAEPFTAPAGAVKAKVSIESGAPSRTKVYIDNIVVSELAEKEPGSGEEEPTISTELLNGDFEALATDATVVPNWTIDPNAKAGTISINTEIVKDGTQSLLFNDNDTNAGLRVISDPVAVTPGDPMLLAADVYVTQQTHNIVLEMDFYTAAGARAGSTIQEMFSSTTLGSKVWATMRKTADVPANAAYMTVSIYSGAPSLTTAYFDNISLTTIGKEIPLDRQYSSPIELGAMVDVSLGQAGAIQTNANGDNEVYFVTNGKPGSFFVLDGDTGALKFTKVIPNTVATWAMTVDQEKNVYFSGTEDGLLYRYNPVTQKVEDLGYNTADSWVWDLEAIDDKIYGGTYSGLTDGKLFEYDITNKTFKNYGVVEAGQQYVRGIAVDDEYIYAAVGTTIGLYKVNRATGEKTEITIPNYSGTTGTMGGVYVINGKIFAAVSTINMVVLDAETGAVDATFTYNDMLSEPDPKNENIVYFKSGTSFYQYDLAAKETTLIQLDANLPDTVRVKDFTWITPQSGKHAGKTILSMLTQYGEYIHIDVQAKTMDYVELDVDLQPVNIQSLQTGFDGRLYLGGYQRGMSVYNPFTETIEVNLPTFAQPEGIGFLNDKVYYGTYVSAVMYAYDITKDAVMNENPVKVFDIEHQDRPFAITSGDDKLFVGTVPDYGFLGGSLVTYDEPSNEWKQFDHDVIVKNQSVIGLAYKDGLLFGSTTLWGGLGIDPSEEEAVIFIWDVKQEKVLQRIKLSELGLNIDDAPKMIGSIEFGPDGLLWGIVDGTIFALNVSDINNITIEKQKMINPSMYNTSKWLPYELRWAPDGLIYTTLSRDLYAIDPETLQYTQIYDGFVNSMTLGIDGTIYFAPEAGTNLSKIVIPQTDATLSELTIDGKRIPTFSPGILTYRVDKKLKGTVAAQAAQAGATVEIEEAGTDQVHITIVGEDNISTLTYVIHYGDIVDPKPTPTPSPGTGSGNTEETETPAAKDTQTVSSEQLSENPVITVDKGVNSVQLPSNAGELAGNQPIVLDNGEISLTLHQALLEQAAKQAGASNSIVVTMKPAEAAKASEAEQRAAQAASAQITFRSSVYEVGLALTNGTSIALNKLESIELSFAAPANSKANVFKLNADGTLQYIPSHVAGGKLIAAVTEAGQYVIAEIDKSFNDVPAEHWASEAVADLASKLIATGVMDSTFAPNREITRAEFMTLIVRSLNLKSAMTADQYFDDVATTAWYASYVAAALEHGIVQGSGYAKFNPNADITREEMAVMLIRAYEYMNDKVITEGSSSNFADADSISSWAADSVAKAQTLQLLNGRGGNSFAPQANLTRAEAIKSIYNLLK